MLLPLLSPEFRLSQRQATRFSEATPAFALHEADSAIDWASFGGWVAP